MKHWAVPMPQQSGVALLFHSPWTKRRKRRSVAQHCRTSCWRRRRNSWSTCRGSFNALNWRKTTGYWPVSTRTTLIWSKALSLSLLNPSVVTLIFQNPRRTKPSPSSYSFAFSPAASSRPSMPSIALASWSWCTSRRHPTSAPCSAMTGWVQKALNKQLQLLSFYFV